MKAGQSSITSLITAYARAYHSQFDHPIIFDDFIAKDLVLEKETKNIRDNLVQNAQFFNKDLEGEKEEEILQWIIHVQLAPITLSRSAFCENILFNEVKGGVNQYLILGAGFDTFCFRYPEFKKALNVFEIDYPATQQFKKERLSHLDLESPSNLHFIPMDFTKGFSLQQLKKNGLYQTKTFSSLLGVSYYLTKNEFVTLFEEIFEYVPSGSSIVFDYADETLLEEKGLFNRVENMVKMAEVSGEPMKSCFSRNEIEEVLGNLDLLIYEHLTPQKINDRYFQNRSDRLSAFKPIHYLHAVKR
ncbi:class I SAM-dependent methyltransferase [Bacillus carboniphilus]|uniref:S-adenosyl-L-methionine-dependent methyltransferase n=1 Tax=Bacillus carboniphilus TaxID=86663 RepID=A0ABY9JTW5_9BACI|nr:class I SAM-dependent methyltransferase [Bacillus carboniphilus]WLR42834.1 class I SAM-dependent methyltransferase [Bacillus carboniphilus]